MVQGIPQPSIMAWLHSGTVMASSVKQTGRRIGGVVSALIRVRRPLKSYYSGMHNVDASISRLATLATLSLSL